ncbi:MAG TPA: DUF4386 domain-containing protein, partial [Anaerolineales bacterium]
MKTQTSRTSPQVYARGFGLLYLTVIVAGIVAQMFISERLVVWGDAAATAANIQTNPSLFQVGFTFYLIEMSAQIAMTGLLYLLLKPVSRSLALLAMSFELAGCVIKTLGRLFYIAPLLVLADNQYLSVFSVEQLQALALLLLKVNDQAAGMALAFFGFSTFLNGYLVFRSNFLPRFLGVISMVGGLGWLTFLYPPLGYELAPYLLLVGIVGGLSQILWFFVKGVNVEQWRQQALETV